MPARCRGSQPIRCLLAQGLFQLVTAQVAWADWDHHDWHGGGRGGGDDPQFDAFTVGMLLIAAARMALALFAGPVLVLFVPRRQSSADALVREARRNSDGRGRPSYRSGAGTPVSGGRPVTHESSSARVRMRSEACQRPSP